jgi:hypothetical protein
MVAILPLLGVSGPRASVSASSALTMTASACLVAGRFRHLAAWNGGFSFLLRCVFLVALPVVLTSLKSSFEQLDDFLNLGRRISFQ